MAGEPKRSPSRTSSKQELRIGTPDVMRAAKITATVVGVVALAVGLWYALTAILLAFAGILLISMAMIGIFSYVGLLILGVPIPFVLALFAGLAGFLPYLGPIIGAVPMVLVAGGEGLDLALWVLGLYAVIQFLESYLLTPLIQARAVSMPPAVVILSQLILGAVFGLLGLALATPLAAAATVPLRYLFGIGESGKAKTAGVKG